MTIKNERYDRNYHGNPAQNSDNLRAQDKPRPAA
jgi:hypothetical protein